MYIKCVVRYHQRLKEYWLKISFPFQMHTNKFAEEIIPRDIESLIIFLRKITSLVAWVRQKSMSTLKHNKQEGKPDIFLL